MTIRISKFKLAVSVLAIAILGAGTAAMATHTFTDVPDGAFYHDPVEWLADNGLTTGSPSGSDTFKPLDGVTRGEYATFNFRYDQNIVQPALESLEDDRSIVAFENEGDAVNDWDGSTQTIDAELTAPSAGYAIVTYSASLARDCNETGTGNVRITTQMMDDDGVIGSAWDHINIDGAPTCGVFPNSETWNDKSISMTRVVAVAAGETTFEVDISHSGSATRLLYIYEHSLSAIFVPIGQPSNDLIITLGSDDDPQG